MLIFAFRAPDDSTRGPVILVLVIERENMVRMTQGDPFDLKLKAMHRSGAAALAHRMATDLDIVVAYEDSAGIDKIRSLYLANDLAGIMKFIERGRTVYEGEVHDPVKLQ